MKRIALLALALLAASAAASIVTPNELAGLWTGDDRTHGSLGTQWFFSGKDHVEGYFGAVVDYAYVVDGKRLKLTFPASEGHPAQQIDAPFVIDGDTFTLWPDEPDKKRVMKRVGKAFPNLAPIVGDWTYPHPAGAPAFEHYSRSGSAQLNVRMTSLAGTYTLADDELTIHLDGQAPREFTMHYAGNSLTLKDDKGETTFRRFQY